MSYTTQNDLLLNKLMEFYSVEDNFQTMWSIINGKSKISLRIVDWFVTNYSKKNFTVFEIVKNNRIERIKVYNCYKLNLKSYQKKRFDPFCRWERIEIPYKNQYIQTTIGQLNFFKWAIENEIIRFIENNYEIIETDMNANNSSSKKKNTSISSDSSIESSSSSSGSYNIANKTRKKREELSINASKGIKRENVHIAISLN